MNDPLVSQTLVFGHQFEKLPTNVFSFEWAAKKVLIEKFKFSYLKLKFSYQRLNSSYYGLKVSYLRCISNNQGILI